MPDALRNVKEFMYARALDGFGVRKYVGNSNLDPARSYIHEFAVPQLYMAVMRDDPNYDPVGEPTSAQTNSAVLEYVRTIMRDMEALSRFDPTGDLYYMMCKCGPEGAFMDELYRAMDADDPEWRSKL